MKQNRTRKEQIKIYLTPEEKELLKDYCSKEKISMSEAVRELILSVSE